METMTKRPLLLVVVPHNQQQQPHHSKQGRCWIIVVPFLLFAWVVSIPTLSVVLLFEESQPVRSRSRRRSMTSTQSIALSLSIQSTSHREVSQELVTTTVQTILCHDETVALMIYDENADIPTNICTDRPPSPTQTQLLATPIQILQQDGNDTSNTTLLQWTTYTLQYSLLRIGTNQQQQMSINDNPSTVIQRLIQLELDISLMEQPWRVMEHYQIVAAPLGEEVNVFGTNQVRMQSQQSGTATLAAVQWIGVGLLILVVMGYIGLQLLGQKKRNKLRLQTKLETHPATVLPTSRRHFETTVMPRSRRWTTKVRTTTTSPAVTAVSKTTVVQEAESIPPPRQFPPTLHSYIHNEGDLEATTSLHSSRHASSWLQDDDHQSMESHNNTTVVELEQKLVKSNLLRRSASQDDSKEESESGHQAGASYPSGRSHGRQYTHTLLVDEPVIDPYAMYESSSSGSFDECGGGAYVLPSELFVFRDALGCPTRSFSSISTLMSEDSSTGSLDGGISVGVQSCPQRVEHCNSTPWIVVPFVECPPRSCKSVTSQLDVGSI